jgi:hypothetical protein
LGTLPDVAIVLIVWTQFVVLNQLPALMLRL